MKYGSSHTFLFCFHTIITLKTCFFSHKSEDAEFSCSFIVWKHADVQNIQLYDQAEVTWVPGVFWKK